MLSNLLNSALPYNDFKISYDCEKWLLAVTDENKAEFHKISSLQGVFTY